MNFNTGNNVQYCSKCGKELLFGARFCGACGSKVEPLIPKDTYTPAPEPAPKRPYAYAPQPEPARPFAPAPV